MLNTFSQTGTSTQRYRRGEIPGVRETSERIINEMVNYTPRASRNQHSSQRQQVRRSAPVTCEYEDIEEVRTTQPVRRTPRPSVTTTYIDEDIEEVRTTRPGRALAPAIQGQQRQIHWLLYVGVAMILLLTVWIIGVHIYVWGVNTFHDPGYYTQTAHRDVITVTDAQGHQEQARAFIDAQNHLDLLIIPGGNISKAHIIQGPDLVSVIDAQHKAYIEVTAEGTSIIVVAHAPLQDDMIAFAPISHDAQWAIDLSQQSSSKGGK